MLLIEFLAIFAFASPLYANHIKIQWGKKKNKVFSHLVYATEKDYNHIWFVVAITYKLHSYKEIILINSVTKNNRKRFPLNAEISTQCIYIYAK